MKFIEQLEAFERLHFLIKKRGTGTPQELANKFQLSVGTIKNLIKALRIKGFPISYCRERQTYFYEYDIDVIIFKITEK